MTHYDTEIIAYNSVIIVTRFADVGNSEFSTPSPSQSHCQWLVQHSESESVSLPEEVLLE
jgi:hypothetical protein